MGDNDAVLNSKQLNRMMGMIYPPPEIKKLVDKTASLVANYGDGIEEKMKEEPNPSFSFLKEGDPYRKYYEQKILDYKKEIKEKEEEEEKNRILELQKKEEFLNKKRESELSLQQPINNKEGKLFVEQLRNLLNSNVENLTNVPSKINYNEIKAPKPDQFSISHPNISEMDLDIIKITAQFIAKNGENFLLDLNEREGKNSQFDFMKPQHNLFDYFSYLITSYSKILGDNREKIKILTSKASDKEKLLRDANQRVLYEQKIKKMMRTKKSEYDFMTEEEKKKSQYIDWNDFVVVETIDFNDEEIENENIDTNNNINNENINKNNEEEINEYNKNENEENENINKENQNQNIEKSNIQSEISVNGIKVIKNYVRQKQSDINDNNKDIKCPLCQIMISSMKFEEHIKLELLDPKWKEIQKDIAKRSKESPLANTSDFISYLSDFSHSRPDLFGNIQDVQKIREQRKKEEKQAQEHKIINENPYMTRTTANIMMFKIQNKTHLEESKKAQNMKNNDDNN